MPIFDVAVTVLSQIRTAKTQQQKPLNHPLESLHVSCCEHEQLALERSLSDLERAGRFEHITLTHNVKKDDIQVQVTFS